jgi:hypothetical protein
MTYLERIACCCLAALTCVALAGCGSGESTVTVTGEVLDGGTAVSIPDYEAGENCLEVEFFPLDEGGNLVSAASYPAVVEEDGSFEVDGPMGEGIPAGKYRVAVRRVGGGEEEEEEEEEAAPTGQWAKFTKENSPFVFEVPGDEIVIDISQAGD